MNTAHESFDFPRVRMRRETRQKLKAQAVKKEMTMQDYLDWLLSREDIESKREEDSGDH